MSGSDLSRLIVQSYIGDDQRIIDPQARADFLRGGSPLGGLYGFNTVSAEDVAAQLGKSITLSAIDLEALPALMKSVNDFSYALQDEDQSVIAGARGYARSYTSIFGEQVGPSYIDLGNFVQIVGQETANNTVKQAAAGVIASIQNAVIAEKHGPGKSGSTGISIYFPNSTLYRSPLAGPQSYTAIANDSPPNHCGTTSWPITTLTAILSRPRQLHLCRPPAIQSGHPGREQFHFLRSLHRIMKLPQINLCA
jgi:hypothetical protein